MKFQPVPPQAVEYPRAAKPLQQLALEKDGQEGRKRTSSPGAEMSPNTRVRTKPKKAEDFF